MALPTGTETDAGNRNAAPASSARSYSVLVVDDDRNMREVFLRMLQRHGCECEGVENGDLALEQLGRKKFDVMVTDLKMPGMSGLELLAAVAELNIDVVPIVVTGNGTIPDAVDALQRGAFDFIEKPHGIRRLEGTVDRAYRHKQLRRYAASMAESAMHWETTFDAVPDLISIVDIDGRFVRINKAMAGRLGIPSGDAAGRSYRVALGFSTPIEGILSELTAESLSRMYSEAFGGAFLVSISPLVSERGDTMGAVHVARDVTLARTAEDRLREAHEETEGLLASMSYFLIGVDSDRRIRRWNDAAKDTFGIAPQDAVGRDFRDCGIQWNWAEMDSAVPDCCKCTATVRLPSIRYTRPDRTDGILDVTISPVRTPVGEPKGICLIGNDVTARKDMEAQLLHAQKLESIGQLASGIAHEINTPIQYVGDNIRFLQDSFRDLYALQEKLMDLARAAGEASFEDTRLDAIRSVSESIDLEYLLEQVPKAIADSLDGVERVASIVLAMKEFSHPGTQEKSPVDLNRAIESTITVARNEWKYVAELEAEFDPGAPPVCCLPGEFNQVVLNILINAAHAIADVVGDGSNGKGKISVVTHAGDDWFEVRISDSGAGIPEKVRTRIFDPFFTTKDVGRGTGQGLAIAHNVIVEKHGGQLTFDTEIGKGTTFTIRLPIDG